MLYSGPKKAGNTAYPVYSAYVSLHGRSKCKHFSVAVHGEQQAFDKALQWRIDHLRIVQRYTTHGKINLPGKRRVVA